MIRQPHDRLIFIMEISGPEKTVCILKLGPPNNMAKRIKLGVIRLFAITPVLSHGVYTVSGRDPVIVT